MNNLYTTHTKDMLDWMLNEAHTDGFDSLHPEDIIAILEGSDEYEPIAVDYIRELHNEWTLD